MEKTAEDFRIKFFFEKSTFLSSFADRLSRPTLSTTFNTALMFNSTMNLKNFHASKKTCKIPIRMLFPRVRFNTS